ncbi:hypothetical protein BT63DRAFT_427456 [Microthyrium microscopicum]|uniref:Geranylgeranyl pyrophosphate synthetase n=1 Tax=Microthyrium microscopicum TaxID=703497 RepID=A0A6A6U7H1_9PEZI|nr:hypothetical protein BT63DRAFT_427456 [Microthyrium microscopicum]
MSANSPNLEVIISRADLKSLQDVEKPSLARISDVTHLSSYNWLEARVPTIAVPGSPALWCPPAGPRKVRKDHGLIYISQNAARHPDCPIEPLFRALYITHPSFDISEVDVISDRNNIRKLLGFINPGSSKYKPDSFSISVEVIKKTAIFSREETATTEFLGPRDFRGFGHEFEKLYTVKKLRQSSGHHRILSYKFGGLDIIIRHETDGFVQLPSDPPPAAKKIEDISNLLGSLTLSTESKAAKVGKTSKSINPHSKLIVTEDGNVVPREFTLEIKTKVFHKPLEIPEIAPQLWVSQTPMLVRAYHKDGLFRDPVAEDVSDKIAKWEQDNEEHLAQLAGLIKKIIEVSKACGGKAIVRYDVKADTLTVSKHQRKDMLPKDLYSKWGISDLTAEHQSTESMSKDAEKAEDDKKEDYKNEHNKNESEGIVEKKDRKKGANRRSKKKDDDKKDNKKDLDSKTKQKKYVKKKSEKKEVEEPTEVQPDNDIAPAISATRSNPSTGLDKTAELSSKLE